jgi:hypothetical protein
MVPEDQSDITWQDLEAMGLTPYGVLLLARNAHTLLLNRRAITERNNDYMARYRQLKIQYEHMVANVRWAVDPLS